MPDTPCFLPRRDGEGNCLTLVRALERSIKKKNGDNRDKHVKNAPRLEHLALGEFGEELAAKFLIEKGYQILHRNVLFRYGEIDIIARDVDEIVFVEVRTRTIGKLAPPETTIGSRKLRTLTRCAYLWADRMRYMGFWRLDLVAITMTDTENKIEHIKTITEAIS